MLFNSWEFILFFCIVFAIYFSIAFRFRPFLLLVASYLFYIFWKWEFAVIMLAVTAVNYYTGLKIARNTSKKQQKTGCLVHGEHVLTRLFHVPVS